MKTLSKNQTNTSILCLLAIVVVVTIAPHAFAQQNPAGQGQQNGIPLGGNYGVTTQQIQPDQGQSLGWGAGIGAAALATGVGMWSIVKRR
ncbi:MAG TPA: hypothetical protein VEU72_01305 [Nitrosopumilaceae archaeon]|nr:hypothetical protein [Nitrosopumilaceae archaeon]